MVTEELKARVTTSVLRDLRAFVVRASLFRSLTTLEGVLVEQRFEPLAVNEFDLLRFIQPIEHFVDQQGLLDAV